MLVQCCVCKRFLIHGQTNNDGLWVEGVPVATDESISYGYCSVCLEKELVRHGIRKNPSDKRRRR